MLGRGLSNREALTLVLASSLRFNDATIRFGGLTAVAPLSFEIPRGQKAATVARHHDKLGVLRGGNIDDLLGGIANRNKFICIY